MAKIDPFLKYLKWVQPEKLVRIATASGIRVDASTGQSRASVIIEAEGAVERTLLARLGELGFQTRMESNAQDGNEHPNGKEQDAFGRPPARGREAAPPPPTPPSPPEPAKPQTVLNGDLPVDNIPRLADIPGLKRAEASRSLYRELDDALPSAKVSAVHAGSPAHRGAGVIIGIIDEGIDYTHPSFIKNGQSRILAIWDQGLTPRGAEANPVGYNYGVQYTKATIDAALLLADPFTVVRHMDPPPFHGTHVAGVAAGSGEPISAPMSGNKLRFVGVAPDADLIVVANTRGPSLDPGTLGDSSDTLDAVEYILREAKALNRPVVINQSQGDNIGPHDGTSSLEVGIAELITNAGCIMVKSAGNEGDRGRHAQGVLTAGSSLDVQIEVPPNTFSVIVDLWYPHGHSIDVSVMPPGSSTPAATFQPPVELSVPIPNGNTVFGDAELNDPWNQDNETLVILDTGTAASVQEGTWTLRLSGTGAWHAWIQRNSSTRFKTFGTRDCTISIPGTGRGIITVGAYVSDAGYSFTPVNSLSSLSSWGPTRDGRQAPTITAPGEELISTQPKPVFFGPRKGTSMSAPMVAGAVALMLEVNPTGPPDHIRDCLIQSAKKDSKTGQTPNNSWGAGKLDVLAACQCIAKPHTPVASPPTQTAIPDAQTKKAAHV